MIFLIWASQTHSKSQNPQRSNLLKFKKCYIREGEREGRGGCNRGREPREKRDGAREKVKHIRRKNKQYLYIKSVTNELSCHGDYFMYGCG